MVGVQEADVGRWAVGVIVGPEVWVFGLGIALPDCRDAAKNAARDREVNGRGSDEGEPCTSPLQHRFPGQV